jgi:GNAT superfamily N-acetyltransferase
VTAPVTIGYLADHPDDVLAVAAWLHDEWGWLTPGSTLAARLAKLRGHCNRDRLPIALVAHAAAGEGNELLGTASLRAADMDSRPALTPWLAWVYVTPQARGRGVGAALVRAIETLAGAREFTRLYLYTPDKQAFYAKLGWAEREWTHYRERLVVVMERTLP